MAGLIDCAHVWPYGTQGPWRRVAKLDAPSSISPGLYDPKQLQTSWNKHVPVPHLGDRWPAPNEGDTWGNVNAQHHMLQNPDPNSYDLGRLEISSTLKVPVPLPRAPGSLSAELAELTGGAPNPAAPEPSKDILEIGKLILSTTSDPVQKHFWESHINTLTKLRMIAIQRPSGLNQEESKVEKLVSDAMKAEAMNLANPAYARAYVAPPPPMSAADIAAALLAAGFGAPMAPLLTPSGTPGLGPMVPPMTPPKLPPGGVALVRDPVGLGAPKGAVLAEYNFIPDDEWKDSADPGTAYYIGSSLADKSRMEANLKVFYKDNDPKNPVKLSAEEMRAWNAAFKLIDPKHKRKPHEKDIPYITRVLNQDSGRIIMAYLSQPKYFGDYSRDFKTSLINLAGYSKIGSFPLHEGMELKPPIKP